MLLYVKNDLFCIFFQAAGGEDNLPQVGKDDED